MRAHKAEGDMDIKQMLEQIVIDVLLVHSAPEWPAALPMLLRLISALNSKAGLLCPDNAVRQFAVDLLGFIAAQLCYESQRAAIDVPAVNQFLEDCGGLTRHPELMHPSCMRACMLPVTITAASCL